MLNDSLFVSPEIHERDVTLPNGQTHKLHFREISERVFSQYRKALRSQDEAEREGASAFLIAESLCNPDGTPAMPVEKAAMLKPAAMNEIMKAILVINDLQADSGKT